MFAAVVIVAVRAKLPTRFVHATASTGNMVTLAGVAPSAIEKIHAKLAKRAAKEEEAAAS